MSSHKLHRLFATSQQQQQRLAYRGLALCGELRLGGLGARLLLHRRRRTPLLYRLLRNAENTEAISQGRMD